MSACAGTGSDTTCRSSDDFATASRSSVLRHGWIKSRRGWRPRHRDGSRIAWRKSRPLHDFLTRGVRTWMLMLLGAVAFVMLLACVNLANLMLVRASSRAHELRIRAALGASRWNLSQALLIESLVLSLVGATLGVFVAWVGVELLRSAMPAEVPRVATIAIELRILAVTGVAAIVTGLAFGTAPVLQFSRPAAGSLHIQGERTQTANVAARWLRASLVVAEVALAVVLLVGSGLFLASFARVTNVDLGMDPHDVLTVRVRPYVGALEGEGVQDLETARRVNRDPLLRILDRVRTIPGVQMASLLGGGLPLRGDLRTVNFGIPGRTLPRNEDIDLNEISPDYFSVLSVPLLKGRLFTEADRQNSEPVVILNEAAVRQYFDDEEVIGKLVQLEGNRRVVGVVGNIRHDGPETWLADAGIRADCAEPCRWRDTRSADGLRLANTPSTRAGVGLVGVPRPADS